MIRLFASFALLLVSPALAQPAPPADAPAAPAASEAPPAATEAPQGVSPPAPVAPAAPAVPTPPAPATVKIAMLTSKGRIVVALEKQRAPVTTANFLRYVDQKRLDGTTFYRANKLDPAGKYGLIQGGVKGDPKRLLPPVAHEPTSKTGLSHVDGTISLARLAPGTATADFFIVVGDLVSLDADPAGGAPGFAAFGRVVEGMDVVHRILDAPVSATAGGPAMKGQMIAAPVMIESVRRVN